jgi:type I restriction enzyme, R subunit
MVEKNFEDDIVNSLEKSGYEIRLSDNYDSKLGLDADTLFRFLHDTQSDEIKLIEHDFGNGTKDKILDTIFSEINQRGLIDVIRNGITINDKKLILSYRKPQSQKNKKAYELYQKNIFTVIRQLHFSQITTESIDLAIFLNGFPITTTELKDQFSKQTVEDAQKQYMKRNTDERIFQFKNGAIVHFAVDYDDIFMTTKLKNQDTVFLPFNKPEIEDKKKYPTSYLWNEIWEKDNLLNIVHNFVHLQIEYDPDDSTKIKDEFLIFPRYHQWDAVNKIILDTKEKGSGNKYLVEHSTGSGKSFSIAWLAYALHSVRDYDEKSIFDGVIVISDRTIIVDQLRDEIKQFDDTEGLVPKIENSNELGNELERSNKILVSTQQKFFDVKDRIETLGGKNYAVIVDEAQSSQGGDASQKVMDALVDLDSFGQKITTAKQNISYFAFSGTPKDKTLAIFGTKLSDGTKVPFHKYTMKQAIDEGYILDVLKNYTTIKRIFDILQKSGEKQVDTKKAFRQIMQMVNEDPKNISKKSHFIVEHFKNHTIKQIGEKAKAMLVTEKRKQAVQYKLAIDDYLAHLGLKIKTLVAFSGTVTVNGVDYTENSLNNPNKEKDFDIAKEFTKDEYRILIVADKFRVGFNQPLLHTMYVDKTLRNVNAVQTLSRLNRTKKGKDDVCVVDFVNTSEEIQEAYSKYYVGVVLSDEIDSKLLYKFYQQVMDFGVILDDDIDSYWDLIHPASGSPAINEELVGATADAVHRFMELDEETRGKFKQFLVKFVENYAYLVQVNDYETENLEKLHRFGRKLLTRLPDPGRIIPLSLKDDVAVRYIDLKETFHGSIPLEDKPGILGKPITVGTQKRPSIIGSLSEVILKINEKYSNNVRTVAETACVEKFVRTLVMDNHIISEFKQSGNTVQNILDYGEYSTLFDKKLDEIESYNPKLFVSIKNDPDWKKQIRDESAKLIDEQIKARGEIELPSITDDIVQNKASYRKALESCKDYLWFEEKHLAADKLDFLDDILKSCHVNEIKILGSAIFNDKINQEFFDKIKKLQIELSQNGVKLTVKIATSKSLHKKFHDRYAIGSNNLWTVPPISAVMEGSAATFNQHVEGSSTYTQDSKSYDDWWNDSDALDIFSEWDKIKKIAELYSKFQSKPQKYNCVECGVEFTKNFKLSHPLCEKHFKSGGK